jgi:hypothetical protein
LIGAAAGTAQILFGGPTRSKLDARPGLVTG